MLYRAPNLSPDFSFKRTETLVNSCIVQLTPGCVAVFRILGVYLDEENYKSAIETISNAASNGRTFFEWSFSAVQELHDLFIKNGNRAEMAMKHKNSAHGWYRSGCEITFLNIQGSVAEFVQLGTIHMYLNDHAKSCSLVAPIHNVGQELQRQSIEDSQISPFHSRTQVDIAEQLLHASPGLVPFLAKMDRREFTDAIAHCPTRMIGFFPKVQGKEIFYSDRQPNPDHGTFEFSESDSIIWYFPEISELMQYDENRVRKTCENRLGNPTEELIVSKSYLGSDISCIELPRSSVGGNQTTVSVRRSI